MTPKAASCDPKWAARLARPSARARRPSPRRSTASTMTPAIFTTNWNASVTTTPHSPEKMRVERGHAEQEEGRDPGIDVERDLQDRHHGPGDPAHDDQVDRQGEIERAEPPQHRRRLARHSGARRTRRRSARRPGARGGRRRRRSGSRRSRRSTRASCPPPRTWRPGPATTSGVSAAKVVATIEVPASHQGRARPETKYSSSDSLARRV